jgi:probable HAF family extracellular repeat protein
MKRFGKGMLRAGLAAMALAIAGSAQAAVLYTVVDIGTLGGSYSLAYAINNAGQITGYSSTTGDTFEHAFLYSGGMMTDLGTVGGRNSYGYGINNAGQVTGYSWTTGNATDHAFLSTGGLMTDLGTLGGSSSRGFGINNIGQVTGKSFTTGDATYSGFLYSGGPMTNIGILANGRDINDAGQFTVDSVLTGFEYAINNSGQITGHYVESSGYSHAFLYSGGSRTDLGTLGGDYSYGYAINNIGQVTGYSFTTGNTDVHPFIYSDGVMSDLTTLIDPASGWVLRYTQGINDSGQIVGYGNRIGSNSLRAFLLNPITSNAAVPEPTTWATMLAGFALMGGALRGTKRRRERSDVRGQAQL